MRIFLTGATGFVGRHAAEALALAGHDVGCLVRDASRAAHLALAGHEIVPGGLSDVAALARGVDGADVVLHVAGLVTARSLTEMRAVNVSGTGRLAGVCRTVAAPPRRFVLVSSLAAAGPGTPRRPRDETDPAEPVSGYGRSKLDGEAAARRALPGATSLVVVRPPAVYGPHDRGILEFFRAAASGVVPRIGTTARAVSIVHGADLATALVAAVEREEAAGGTYHVANDAPHAMDDLLARIARAVGRRTRTLPLPECAVRLAGVAAEEIARLRGVAPTFSRDKVQEFLAPGWVCSGAGALRDLAWRPRIGIDEGLAATAAWYRGAGWIPSGRGRVGSPS